MFESSSYGDGYYKGNKKGKTEGKVEATELMILNMAKQGIAIEIIVDITERTREEIKLMLEAEGEDWDKPIESTLFFL